MMARDLGLLVLRLIGLYLALGHGWGKLIGLASGQSRFAEGVASLGFPAPIVFAWAAALAECVGGIAVALGFFTRWAAAAAAFTMFVAAFFQAHAFNRFLAFTGIVPASEDTLKGWGNPELAIAYLVVFLALALIGPGRFSIDAKLKRA